MLIYKNKVLLFLTSVALISSCSFGKKKSDSDLDIKLWSAYSTNKVIQQTYRNSEVVNNGETVKIHMMMDEYESSQLIITSNKKAYFDLTKTELVDSSTGNKIPEKNIEIYVQKYMKLTMIKHTNANDAYYSSGDNVPDMLLPLEYAKKSAENFVEKDSNQGLTIEVDSNGLLPGTYKGTFVLDIDGKKFDVPIEVTIWDIKFDGKSSIQSCWLIYSMYMFTGEYDASRNMLNTYADFLSKYKANPYIIQEHAMNSPEAFMQDVERMWKIKNYNSIIIPYDFPLTYNVAIEGEDPASYIVKLAEKSTEENFYLDYALFYPSTYDEADVNASKKEASPSFFRENGRYQQTLEKAISMLTSKGYFLEHDEEWNLRVKQAIRNIPDVFTNCNYVEKWVEEYPTTFCPQINVLDSQKIQEVYQDYARENANNNFWTYTCVSPNYPYPSHHMDDDCLSMRVMGWMEKAYNINGYLYYMANMYTTENDASQYTTPYTVADRNNGANGDGFVMYPGRAYGSSTPFPSMRLVTYRDGLEDYDMLEVYQREIEKLCRKYGVSDVDSRQYVSDLYSSLFTNAVPTRDQNALFEARKKLANKILSLKDGNEFLTNETKVDGKIVLDVYTNKNTISVNDTSRSGTSVGTNAYSYRINLQDMTNDLSIKVGNVTYAYKNPKYNAVTSFTSSSNIECSKDSSFVVEGGVLKANIVSVLEDTASKTIRFTPYVSLKNINIKDAKKLILEYENTSSTQNLLFDVDLVTSIATYTVGGHFCLKNNQKKLEIDLTKSSIDLSKVKDLRLTFVNYYFDDSGNLQVYSPRDIAISNVHASY